MLPESCRSQSPPPRLTEQEVLELSGLSKSTLSSWKSKKRFPKPLFYTRKYGNIYNGKAVYEALGFIDKSDDPFYDAIWLT